MFDERPDTQDRLADELIIRMTTVDGSGQPRSSPVWFLAHPDHVVVCSLSQTPRTRDIGADPRVSLDLNGSRSGWQLVITEGEARMVADAPPAVQDLDYLAKDASEIHELGMTPDGFARDYPVCMHVRPTRSRAS